MNEPITASKKRMFLAFYLEFILFMVLWGLLGYLFANKINLPFWMAILTFALIKVTTHKHLGSPGMHMLSISKDKKVNPEIYHRESWLTISLGVLFIMEGTKQMVRWTQFWVPQPFFGFIPAEGLQIAIQIVSGTLFVGIGYLFLKLNMAGYWLGIIASLVTIVSCVLGWSLWNEAVEKMVVARRTFQGMPVREIDIKIMQMIVPEGTIVLAFTFLIAILLTYRRFTPHSNS